MIRLDKICVWMLIICFAGMIWSGSLVKPIDELACYVMLAVGLLDCVFNHRWRVYFPLILVLAIMAGYVIYSTFKGFNTLPYIFMDAIIELKPFVPFMVLLAIRPQLGLLERKVFKAIAIVNMVTVVALYFMPVFREYTIQLHIMFLGASCFISMLVYLFCSIDEEGKVSPADMAVILLLLVVGLGCTRAKYYAEAVLAVFFILIYRPGMFKGVKPGYWLLAALVVVAVVAVGWHKFSYYFLTGEGNAYDPTVADSFARPVLYATSGLILVDHIPFGSGLASFASYASSANYSSLYYEYGINNIHGLSESNPDFICDAFYPSLAQFGIVGIILFVVFLVWAFKPAKRLLRLAPERYRYHYVIASLVMCFLLVESIASTIPMQTWGLLAMSVLGLVAAQESCARTVGDAPTSISIESSHQLSEKI
ncbi:MAG: hypothetical protein J5565_06900 [Muribaculaceae bacterium]|nr:hypothetical protein [Muribaculaceae bacterium]